jgi:hypothetical protein
VAFALATSLSRHRCTERTGVHEPPRRTHRRYERTVASASILNQAARWNLTECTTQIDLVVVPTDRQSLPVGWLTDDDLRRFAVDGYLVVRDAVPEALLAAADAEIDGLIETVTPHEGDLGPGQNAWFPRAVVCREATTCSNCHPPST